MLLSTYEVTEPVAELFQFHRGQDVFFMLMLVAFLMLFIRRYEWGVALATMLSFVVAWPLYLLISNTVLGIDINIESVILAVFCAITLVIAIGVFLGQISTIHYITAAVLFVPAYMFNEWFIFSFLDGVLDAGGSILVHMFAAYWGWGVILGLRNRKINDEPMKTSVHSVSFVWLASMLLLVLWPSFVTALLPPEEVLPAMFTCYMALVASALSTYLLSYILKKEIDPLVYTYAMLAGGVAIGATVNLVGPLTGWIIGFIAGLVSTWCFYYLHDWLNKTTGVLDTMGVHNLHGVPGIVGAVAAMVVAGAPLAQLWAILGTLVIGIVTGGITGLILKIFKEPKQLLDDSEAFDMTEARTPDSPLIHGEQHGGTAPA
ncbi:ammonium transporter [Micrococcoides hystricis]|uniref:Ammonium transporter n=1 Tax=Micrococcoides hystricis TaxID=1572761 RepID=A0ABV6P7N7_9MICC